MVQSQPGQIVCETLSQKTLHKKGLVEWIKVKALSSSPSTAKKINKLLYLVFDKSMILYVIINLFLNLDHLHFLLVEIDFIQHHSLEIQKNKENST
jgi:hypothetical protein